MLEDPASDAGARRRPRVVTDDDALAVAEQIGRDVAAQHARAVDEEARWPVETLRALQAAGLGGLVVPASHGGLGGGLLTLARVCEVIGRHCASSALCFGMHCVGSAVIAAKATDDQVERLLRPISAGEHLTTLALSEPGTGAQFYLPRTEFTAADGGYRVTGTKSFVTNGGHADSYVISVAEAGGQEVGEFSCLTLPAETPRLEWGDRWDGLGMRGNSARTLRIDGAVVAGEDLLGTEGDQIWYVFNVVAPFFLMAMSGTYLGVAAAALEHAREHLSRRAYATTGRSLASEPVLQHRLGALWARVEATRALMERSAAAADAGDPNALPGVLSTKAEVADAAVWVTDEAMNLMGGRGYRDGGELHRHLRDARAAPVMSPTTDLLRTWTGRSLLGQPILAD
jgi:alkylation response protein AidB-like acyl-CoA dehydrogenase